MLPVPILPEEALSRNISLDVIGVILAVYTITFLLSSFILGKMMALWGKIRFLNFSLSILFLTTFFFGVIMLIREKNIFIFVTCLLRLLQGLACGGYSVIIYSMVPEYYPDRIEQVFSYMELFSGLSTAFAPLLGMFLFQLVGSGFTFMIFSFAYLFLLVLINKNMQFKNEKKSSKELKSQGERNVSMWELIKNRQYMVTFAIYTINSIGFFVVNPILGERVKEITGETSYIGVCFSTYCICYAAGGISLGHLFTKYKLNKRFLLILASILLFLSYSLMGSTDDFSSLILSLIFLGFGEAFNLIPYIVEAIELGTNVYPNDHGWVGDMASLFWNIGFALGEFAGPIMGGSLTQAYGFSACVWIYAILVAGMLGIYLIFGSVLTRFTGLDERLLSEFAVFGGEGGSNAKFFTNEGRVVILRPVFLKSI